jgi:hypothetical protein
MVLAGTCSLLIGDLAILPSTAPIRALPNEHPHRSAWNHILHGSPGALLLQEGALLEKLIAMETIRQNIEFHSFFSACPSFRSNARKPLYRSLSVGFFKSDYCGREEPVELARLLRMCYKISLRYISLFPRGRAV